MIGEISESGGKRAKRGATLAAPVFALNPKINRSVTAVFHSSPYDHGFF